MLASVTLVLSDDVESGLSTSRFENSFSIVKADISMLDLTKSRRSSSKVSPTCCCCGSSSSLGANFSLCGARRFTLFFVFGLRRFLVGVAVVGFWLFASSSLCSSLSSFTSSSMGATANRKDMEISESSRSISRLTPAAPLPVRVLELLSRPFTLSALSNCGSLSLTSFGFFFLGFFQEDDDLSFFLSSFLLSPIFSVYACPVHAQEADRMTLFLSTKGKQVKASNLKSAGRQFQMGGETQSENEAQ